jgi:two-component system, chemotaxis family, chemotaxis protein CheY
LPNGDAQSKARIGTPVKSAKILIVDDEYSARKLLRALLSSVGASNIYDAADGTSGLDAIRALSPDVVLLDWDMPGMDGAEFTRRVRSPGTCPCPNVPIIMLTSHSNRARVLEAVRLGIHEFLLKPVSSGALLTRIESALLKPRSMMQRGDHDGSLPRKRAAYK